jgi:ribulose-phosphate 3-epimerase
MSVIVPTILTDNADDYHTYIEKIHPFAERIHVDISDGEFAPNYTIGPDQIWWPKEWEVDIHAMVARPNEYVERLINLKPHMIIFHVEAMGDEMIALIHQIQKAGIKAGVALLKTTVPSNVQEIIKAADHVMVFTGTLGQYGGVASMMQLEKVRLIKNINPKTEIGWDGGVNIENAFTLTQGGVDVLNVGSTIAKSDNPEEMYKKLVSEANKHGVI